MKHYFIGNTISYEYLSCVPQVKGQELTVVCMAADANMRISKIQFEEKDGVINISCKGVQRDLVDVVGVKGSYVAEKEIEEVRLGDRILWARGEYITTFTSSVYKTKHAEIQDTKTNIDTATALYLGYVFPGYKSVVQKENEPYGWHFQKGELLGDVKYLEKQYLEPYAYIMMAVVENLGEVTYEFRHRGEPITLTYTTEMATKYAGKDIKAVGEDIAELEKLIRKANLTDTHFWTETESHESNYETPEHIELEILNKTGEEIWGINTIYYDDEDNKITELEAHYDARGFDVEEWPIPVMVQDLFAYIDIERPDELYLRFEFNDIDNVTYSTGDCITLPMEFGTKYQMELSGNAEEGYHVTLK